MKTDLPLLTLSCALVAYACSNSPQKNEPSARTTNPSSGGNNAADESGEAGAGAGLAQGGSNSGSDSPHNPLSPDDPTLLLIDSLSDQLEERLVALGEGNAGPDQYYCYTDAEGRWDYVDVQSWCSGFLPGIYWLAGELLGVNTFGERASSLTNDVSRVAVGPDNDTGFQIYGSSGLALLFSPDRMNVSSWEDNVLTGAHSLYTQRYNATIGAFRSWAQEQDDPYEVSSQIGPNGGRRFEVNIDMLMNMELVLRAADILERRGDDDLASEYRAAAESHFDTTWRDLVRADGSTYHVVQYGPDGEVLNKRTHQGYQDESTWSRGQAWVIYGHSMFHRYQPQEKWLERATVVSEYYLDQTADQSIPPSDFDQPSGAAPRDTSAAAIVCSAFVEMSSQVEAAQASTYLEHAQDVLARLSQPEIMNGGPSTQESILWGCTEKYGEPEVGCAFGDYYFLECMQRYVQLGQ